MTARGLLFLLFLGLAGAGNSSDSLAQESRPGSAEVVAAVPRHFPPIYDTDAEGRPVGYAIDLMDALAERGGFRVRYVVFENWRGVADALATGTADIIPNSGFAADRTQAWSYSVPTDRFSISFFVLSKSQIHQGEGLVGKRVGVSGLNAARRMLLETNKYNVIDFSSYAEVLVALLRGKVDVMAFPAPVAWRLASEAGIADHLREIGDPILTVERGVAVRKDRADLLPLIDAAIEDFIGTPQYRSISDRWYAWSRPYWTVDRVVWASAITICLVVVLLVAWRVHSLRRSQRRLRESENLVRLLLDSVTVGFGVEDISGRTIDPNEGLARLLGYTPQELQSMRFTEYTDPEFAEADAASFRELAAGRLERYQVEKRYISKHGAEVWGRVTRTLLRDENGNPHRCFGVLEDITDRKRAENALIAREAQLAALIDDAPVGVFFKDKDSRYLLVNQTYCDFHGLDRETVVGRCPQDFQSPDHARRTLDEDRRVLESGRTLHMEETLVSGDGTARHFSLNKFPVTDADGSLLGLGGMSIEITGMKDAENYAVGLSERMHRILDSAGEGICELGMDGAVTFMNSTGASMLGWKREELTGKRLHEVVHSKRGGGTDYKFDDCPVCKAIRTANDFTSLDELFWKKNGDSIPVDLLASSIVVAGEQTGVVLVFKDITERLSIERQLRQAQKMQAVGQLTGGVAHDFNNLLQVIETNLELAREQVRSDAGVEPLIGSASRAVRRGANLTQKLLAFSRKQTLFPEVHDPGKLIDGMLNLLRRTLGEDIRIEKRNDAGTSKIHVDAPGFENVLLNLALNARAAMPKGGALTIVASRKYFDEGVPVETEVLPPGNYVEIAVADTGCGMSEETMRQAFEPFFTTKEVGEGSGLGLSLVYGFARQSGGDAKIESEVGKGTTVRMVLPVVRGESESAEENQCASKMQEHNFGVLLVEDDADVRASTAMLLRSLGCDVREAVTSSAAMKTLRADDRIDLLLSDVVLSGERNGIELAREATGLRPFLKVLLVSGYPDAALEEAGVAESQFSLLRKPFSKAELSDALRSVMGPWG